MRSPRSLCLSCCLYIPHNFWMSLIVARQQIGKHVPAVTKTHIHCISFYEVRDVSKKSRRLVFPRPHIFFLLRYFPSPIFLSSVVLLSNFPVKILYIILIFRIRGVCVCSTYPFDFTAQAIRILRIETKSWRSWLCNFETYTAVDNISETCSSAIFQLWTVECSTRTVEVLGKSEGTWRTKDIIIFRMLNVRWKVELSLYRPWRPLREVESPTFSDIRLTDDGKVVSPTCPTLFTPRQIPCSQFCYRLMLEGVDYKGMSQMSG
jgi:hypothetical protein